MVTPARSAIMAPPLRVGRSPTQGIQPAWCWCMRAVPRVAVSSWDRNPIRPRDGASMVTTVRPVSPGRRSVTRPLRGARAWVTVPTCSSGTSMTRPLERLVAVAVDLADDDLGPADLQLVALPAHRLDEHGQLELASPGHLDDVGRAGLVDPDRDVAQDLAVEALAKVAGGEVRAFLAGQRRGVDAEGHAQHRLVDGEAGQRLRGRRDRRGCRRSRPRGSRRPRTGRRPRRSSASRRPMPEKPMSWVSLRRSGVCPSSSSHSAICSPRRSVPSHDAADGQPTEVVGGVEVGDDRLQRRRRDHPSGAGTVVTMASNSGVRSSSSPGMPTPATACAVAGDGRDHRELDGRLVGVEVEEQLVDLVEDLVGAGVAGGRPC